MAEGLAKPRILLADDTLDSQFVVAKLLERHGYCVTVASDGHEAIAAWQESPFDAILMDVQMPGLDGFQTTQLIRDHERNLGQAAIPVVALTGHTGDDDRERCLRAGMTTHLPKPIEPQRLLALLAHLLVSRQDTSQAPPPPPPGFEFDAGGLVERMEGDLDLVKKLISFFERDRPVLMEQLRKAIEEQDATALSFAAHRLSGLVRNFGAAAAARSALRLETMARDGDLSEAQMLFNELSQEIEQLTLALQDFCARL